VFLRIFGLTWLVYCGYYLCRKNFSVLMPFLKSELGYTSESLAHVLFLYGVAYSLGQFLMGHLADRFGARIVVTCGALGSALASGLTGSAFPLAVSQSANGLLQASGWPGVLKMSQDWFPASTFSQDQVRDSAHGGRRVASGPMPVPPGLVAIAVMYFFVKMTRYSFLFWLPMYMTERLLYSPVHAGYASSIYEAIGFLGVLLAGYISERAARGNRFPVGAVMMAVLAVLCAAYPWLSRFGPGTNLAAIALIGAFTFGPDTLMAGSGTQEAVPLEATARAAGFVNGVGSVGQVLSPYFVAIISSQYGWDAMFYSLSGAAVLGGAALATQWRRS
jgi:sugar phosphate permease